MIERFRNATISRKTMESLTDKFVVFLVGADPHPLNAATDLVAQGAIMIAHSYGKAVASPGKFLEIKRGMARIATPEPVIFQGQTLNGFRQFLIALPKPAGGFGGHSLSGGQSRSKPA